jgi:RimJ/RimL family protein N-acetyltransferase
MKLKLNHSTTRPLRLDDAQSLVRHANNRQVWRNLRDLMPHPYGEADAYAFISHSLVAPQPTSFAIEVDGAAVGVVGVRMKEDIERNTAELGYWLGEAYWGRGILSEVVTAFTPWALKEFKLLRIEAVVFEWNPASARVLEKAGYTLEGVMRRSAVKDGVVIDRSLYAYVGDHDGDAAAETDS